MKIIFKILRAIVLIVAALVLLYGLMRWRGFLIYPQEANPPAYQVFGVDVSSYQGEIHWETLKAQGVQFAFIKATEGSGMTDSQFAASWQSVHRTDILAGAYHFFSYDSSAQEQASNFIAAVPVTENALPPVVDLEFYGNYIESPKDSAAVIPVLQELLERLETQYGKKPILYVTDQSYRLYVKGHLEDYPLWVSMPVLTPFWRDWSFWQYSHKALLTGYAGPQKMIDLNVFRGSLAELQSGNFR
ncbi:MAG: GH25 family lysozyme [Oscillospiraceae bacterium]